MERQTVDLSLYEHLPARALLRILVRKLSRRFGRAIPPFDDGVPEDRTWSERPPKIHVIAVAFQRFGELEVFVRSLQNQTAANWGLTVIHDGPDPEFTAIMNDLCAAGEYDIDHFCTEQRYGDWGHSLREIGLARTRGDFVILTNADNYFIPRTVEFLNEYFRTRNPDALVFNMVHSHRNAGVRRCEPYSFLETHYRRFYIDISAALIRSELAARAGFRDKSHDADATYFEDVAAVKEGGPLVVGKIPNILLVHN
ncbi:MAG: glycosyltransferase family 2 protein [Paracoccaceae bacterium]